MQGRSFRRERVGVGAGAGSGGLHQPLAGLRAGQLGALEFVLGLRELKRLLPCLLLQGLCLPGRLELLRADFAGTLEQRLPARPALSEFAPVVVLFLPLLQRLQFGRVALVLGFGLLQPGLCLPEFAFGVGVRLLRSLLARQRRGDQAVERSGLLDQRPGSGLRLLGRLLLLQSLLLCLFQPPGFDAGLADAVLQLRQRELFRLECRLRPHRLGGERASGLDLVEPFQSLTPLLRGLACMGRCLQQVQRVGLLSPQLLVLQVPALPPGQQAALVLE